MLFQVPEESGAFDCSVPVSRGKNLEMESKCAYEDDENVFQEYFYYVMEEEGLQYPSNYEEALFFIFSTQKYCMIILKLLRKILQYIYFKFLAIFITIVVIKFKYSLSLSLIVTINHNVNYKSCCIKNVALCLCY